MEVSERENKSPTYYDYLPLICQGQDVQACLYSDMKFRNAYNDNLNLSLLSWSPDVTLCSKEKK